MTQETAEQAAAPDHAPEVQETGTQQTGPIEPDQSLKLNAALSDASNIAQGTKEQETAPVQIPKVHESGTQQATTTQQIAPKLTKPRKINKPQQYNYMSTKERMWGVLGQILMKE